MTVCVGHPRCLYFSSSPSVCFFPCAELLLSEDAHVNIFGDEEAALVHLECFERLPHCSPRHCRDTMDEWPCEDTTTNRQQSQYLLITKDELAKNVLVRDYEGRDCFIFRVGLAEVWTSNVDDVYDAAISEVWFIVRIGRFLNRSYDVQWKALAAADPEPPVNGSRCAPRSSRSSRRLNVRKPCRVNDTR